MFSRVCCEGEPGDAARTLPTAPSGDASDLRQPSAEPRRAVLHCEIKEEAFSPLRPRTSTSRSAWGPASSPGAGGLCLRRSCSRGAEDSQSRQHLSGVLAKAGKEAIAQEINTLNGNSGRSKAITETYGIPIGEGSRSAEAFP